ncbi:MAG: AraC family transcriptional regulator [Tepidanaerobacteraceae bacterium]|nr:AraC family transcriptional regulator [Thermoanaerobacterales bacterium]
MGVKDEKGQYNKNFSLYHSVGMSASPDFHFHDYIEIYLSVSGGKQFIINDKIYDIHPADLFIIKNHEIHKATCADNIPYERYFLQFDPEFLLSYCTPKTNLLQFFDDKSNSFGNKIHLSDEQNIHLINLFKKYLNIDASFGKDVLEEIYFIEIILYIAQLCYTNKSLDTNYYSNDYIPIVKQLLDYINLNITEDLSLDHLAKEINVSKSYMCKMFRKYTGTTINKYITARRITEAKRLLKMKEPIATVCEKTGFNNYSHFIRTFTNLVGFSPMKYAKKVREK